MGQSSFQADTGSTINLATYLITEGATSVHVAQSVIVDSTGNAYATAANPLNIIGTTSVTSLPAITGSVTVAVLPAITGSVTIAAQPTVTGSVTIVTLPAITGSTTVASVSTVVTVTGSTVPFGPAGTPSTNVITVQGVSATNATPLLITGSTTIVSIPAVTGSVTLVGTSNVSVTNTPTITGSVSIVTAPAITGSVSVVNTPTVTGSVSVVNTPTVTGSVSVVNTPTVTGSVSVINTPSVSSTQVGINFMSAGVLSINTTTVGTSIIVPSTAANSIYITDLVVSLATGGTILFGYAAGAVAPTGAAINIQTLYLAANGGMVWPIVNPIKLPASTNFVCTSATAGTLSVTATYYVAP